MLGDHYPRIRAQQQHAIENAVIEELEKHAAPLLWAVIAALAVFMVADLVNNINAFVHHYNSLVETNHAMAECMNGHAIGLGSAELNCDVREYKHLVSGLAQGGQP